MKKMRRTPSESRAAAAGADMLLVCHTEARQVAAVDSLADAMVEGRIGADRVRAAHRAIDELAATFCEAAPAPVLDEASEEGRGGEGDDYWTARMAVIGCRDHSRLVEEIELKAERSWEQVLERQRQQQKKAHAHSSSRRRAGKSHGGSEEAAGGPWQARPPLLLLLGVVSCAALALKFKS